MTIAPWLRHTDAGTPLASMLGRPVRCAGRRAPPRAVLEGGAGWAVLEAVAAHSAQYELTCRQQPSGLERGDAKRLKVCVVVSFASCIAWWAQCRAQGTRCVAAPVVRPRKCQQARRARRAQLCSDARLRPRPGERLRGSTHLPVPPPESVPEGVIVYSAVLHGLQRSRARPSSLAERCCGCLTSRRG